MNDIKFTFDDVQIEPKYSDIESRSECDVSTMFSRNHKMKIPIVASPMDTVCEAQMAMTLLELGGVGVIHRFMSVDNQASNVKDVALVARELNTFAKEEGEEETKYIIAAAVGVNGDSEIRARKLIEAGANALVIDVAHGHHVNVKRMMEYLLKLKNVYDFDIVAGSIATHKAAQDLRDWGADALRVGVGGGSVCETRIRTGIGVPQLQSILDIGWTGNIPIISDGGIRYPGDAAKALVAGADSVMIGSLFAGTEEAPGEVFIGGQWPDNKRFKVYRGLASATTKIKYTGAVSNVEGASRMVENRGPVHTIVNDIVEGIQSSMSYVGARNISEFRANAHFIGITNAGLTEAHPHGLR